MNKCDKCHLDITKYKLINKKKKHYIFRILFDNQSINLFNNKDILNFILDFIYYDNENYVINKIYLKDDNQIIKQNSYQYCRNCYYNLIYNYLYSNRYNSIKKKHWFHKYKDCYYHSSLDNSIENKLYIQYIKDVYQEWYNYRIQYLSNKDKIINYIIYNDKVNYFSINQNVINEELYNSHHRKLELNFIHQWIINNRIDKNFNIYIKNT